MGGAGAAPATDRAAAARSELPHLSKQNSQQRRAVDNSYERPHVPRKLWEQRHESPFSDDDSGGGGGGGAVNLSGDSGVADVRADIVDGAYSGVPSASGGNDATAARNAAAATTAAFVGDDSDESVYPDIRNVPKDVDFKQVSQQQVAEFLRLLGLKRHVARFVENCVDGELLLELTRDMLVDEFGLTTFEALKLHKFVHEGWRMKSGN